MSNMIKAAKEQIDALVRAAYSACVEKGVLPAGVELKGTIEQPRDLAFGDYACGYAMSGAKAMRMNPRVIAQSLVDELKLDGSYFRTAEVAGAGFINLRLSDRWYAEVLADVEREGADYGRTDTYKGKKVMVEFVSANPTGPMHMGNARGGVLGDALASVLDAAGCRVWREFYVNDAGNQIDKFAHSLDARYLQLIKGEDAVEFPEDGYHGEDIKELAAAFRAEFGDEWAEGDETQRRARLAEFGLSRNIPKMKADLERYNIHYDRWFYESTLHESGYVAETVDRLTELGHTYEKDGALWLRTAQILTEGYLAAGKTQKEIDKLDLKDDVLRRANGFYTYFAADIAYHRDKFEKRGFEQVINVWGADHHGHVARLKGAMDALGLDGTHRLDIVLMQLVKLVRDGEVVRMSKRTGKSISLSDLLDEIPVDAARYFFNSRPDSHLEFDLGLAVRQDSENPVYYVQYAHARICSLVAALAADGYAVPQAEQVNIAALNDEYCHELIKQLATLPEEIIAAGRELDPSRISRYVTELAGRFHRFYNADRIRGAETEQLTARLKLADTTRVVISDSLALLGVSAPEKM